MREMTNSQRKEFKRKYLKAKAKEIGVERINTKVKKKLGIKIGTKLGAGAAGGLLSGGVATLFSLISAGGDVIEICECAWKCRGYL